MWKILTKWKFATTQWAYRSLKGRNRLIKLFCRNWNKQPKMIFFFYSDSVQQQTGFEKKPYTDKKCPATVLICKGLQIQKENPRAFFPWIRDMLANNIWSVEALGRNAETNRRPSEMPNAFPKTQIVKFQLPLHCGNLYNYRLHTLR